MEMVQYNNNRGLEQSGGLEMVRYNKSQGFEQSGGEAGQIKNSHFSFSELNTYLYNISEVTEMHCTHEL